LILVFGKTGQVAKELGMFENVITLDRTQVDLKYPHACADIILDYKPEAVINAAAYTAVDMAEIEEELANIINGESPGAMAHACAELKIPLVHISTDYVFKGIGEIPWQSHDKTNPQNAYGRSKLKGEQAISRSGASFVILRTSWVISAHGHNFVKKMLDLSKIKDSLTVVDDQVGGPTPARNIAKACIDIVYQLIKAPDKSGIYNFSGKPDVSWCQFANIIFQKVGRKTLALPISSSEYQTLASRPLNSRIDCGSTERTFNILRPLWCNGLKEILIDLER